MKTIPLTDEQLQFMSAPPKNFLYWLIKDTYTVVAIVESWNAKTITLKTEHGATSTENRDDVKFIIGN
ncbi:hypothetical protein [Acinetobacter calcoaceticus]|jgi:hypothetical protein|uniref:hypothetical protein n=1 Tax=Acinetobacter calcoaceticus TaxID=471 RepID=UPI0018DBB88E|nr:hypothetical protein [Acinetobacter calcoaceticus]